MKHVLVLSIALLFALPATAQDDKADDPELPIVDAQDAELSEFLWVSRPVIVFADSPNDPRFREQMRMLRADPGALTSRDVVLVIDTDPAARSPVRQELFPRGFSLVLISKDGNSRIRKPLPWDTREIGRWIDKLPIRQDEIREMNQNDGG